MTKKGCDSDKFLKVMAPLLGIKKKVPIKQMHIYKGKKKKGRNRCLSLAKEGLSFLPNFNFLA